MRYIKRALSDTFLAFGGSGLIISLLAVPVVGFTLHYFVSEVAAVEQEIHGWLIYGLASTIVVFATVLILNLACTPYRLEKEDHQETRRLLERATEGAGGEVSVAEFIKSREKFTLKEAACIKARTPISNGELTGPASGFLRDLKQQVLSGSLIVETSSAGVPGAMLELLHRNPGIGNSMLFSERDINALADCEVSKNQLEKIGFLP